MIAKLMDAGSYVLEMLAAGIARRLERKRLRLDRDPVITVTGVEQVPRAERMW